MGKILTKLGIKCQKKFGSKNNLDRKQFWVQKQIEKYFGPQNAQKFGSEKRIFCVKYLWYEKNLGPIRNFGAK